VTDLIAKLAKQKDVIIDFQVLKGATHFYNEHLDELEQTTNSYLNRRIGEIEAAAAARTRGSRSRRLGDCPACPGGAEAPAGLRRATPVVVGPLSGFPARLRTAR